MDWLKFYQNSGILSHASQNVFNRSSKVSCFRFDPESCVSLPFPDTSLSPLPPQPIHLWAEENYGRFDREGGAGFSIWTSGHHSCDIFLVCCHPWPNSRGLLMPAAPRQLYFHPAHWGPWQHHMNLDRQTEAGGPSWPHGPTASDTQPWWRTEPHGLGGW